MPYQMNQFQQNPVNDFYFRNAQGNWQRRIEWTTGLGGDGAFSGNVYGNGEYWPRDPMTCNIKNMLPTV